MNKQFWATTCHNLMVTSLIIGMALSAVDTSEAYSIHPVVFKTVIFTAFVLNALKYRITPYQNIQTKRIN